VEVRVNRRGLIEVDGRGDREGKEEEVPVPLPLSVREGEGEGVGEGECVGRRGEEVGVFLPLPPEWDKDGEEELVRERRGLREGEGEGVSEREMRAVGVGGARQGEGVPESL